MGFLSACAAWGTGSGGLSWGGLSLGQDSLAGLSSGERRSACEVSSSTTWLSRFLLRRADEWSWWAVLAVSVPCSPLIIEGVGEGGRGRALGRVPRVGPGCPRLVSSSRT